MRDDAPSSGPAAPQKIYLKDYRPPAYFVDDVHLTFRLSPDATRVLSRIRFRPNADAPGPFFLNGEGLNLLSASIDGIEVTPEFVEGGLACSVPDAPFFWESEVEISPVSNTALEGLYMSRGMYCTQCEAEGFRKITYYPDRPDVMAPFTVRVEGDHPVLLSNGNPKGSGDGWAEWVDPWPKPSYLFALVAGELEAHRDSFTTASGRDVDLAIWVRAGDLSKCAFGMDALKTSMAWDERVYGREYDLDIFNVVAVDDFNGGAMENKGLNIFNSAAVLASATTATDANFERIESIIAHEYFHNWTGNRITCRDWFQLCLKEGLTVFRDQQFTSDLRSASVKRIDDVLALRARQFREDNGPLAHPVRPASFVEINNFYTATVYDKGAELIGMLKTLVGDDNYARALTLYFDRHDGEACTIEDWLAVFEDVSGRDLQQFKLWYSQAGTPRLKVEEHWDNGTYSLIFHQETAPTPGQAEKFPLQLPIRIGLLNADGSEAVGDTVLEMTEATQSFSFEGLSERPVPSILRNFSAPVILDHTTSTDERAFLLAHDSDPFNRWEAGRSLAKTALISAVIDGSSDFSGYIEALANVLPNGALDPAFRALVLRLPSEDDLAQTLHDAGITPDPDAIYVALERLRSAMSVTLEGTLEALFEEMQVSGPYQPYAAASGKRALANGTLTLLSRRDAGTRASKQFAAADNMTLQMGALVALLGAGQGRAELDAFYQQWKSDRLVMDKWFGLQTTLARPDTAAATAVKLTQHADFDWQNPNRFRAVFGGLAANQAGFHDQSGASYNLVADWLMRLDEKNPQLAAGMSTIFQTWRRYDADRQGLIRDALQRIVNKNGLSRDMTEMLERILG